MQVLSFQVCPRDKVWNIHAQILENGVQERVRFSSGFKVMQENDKNKLFLEQNAKELIRLYRNEKSNFKEKSRKLYKSFLNDDKFLFKNQAKDFLNSLQNVKRSTFCSAAERLIPALNFFEFYSVKSIKREDIERFFDYLDSKDYVNSTKKGYAKALNRVLNYALDKDIILKNPLKMRKSWSGGREEVKCFNTKEIQNILQNAKGDIGLYLKIGLLCGARMGEILALQWKNIDFDNAKIHIEKSISHKNGGLSSCKTQSSHRVIDCVAPLLKALKETKERKNPSGDDFIFKGVHKPYIKSFHNSYLKTQYAALLMELNIDYIPIYNTRHSFASLMLSKGENIMWVSWMLGHKNSKITLDFYSKFLPSDEKRASFLESFIGGGY